MSIIEKIVDSMVNTYSKEMPLSALYLMRPVRTSKEMKNRIVKGDEICIRNSELIDCSPRERATHVIVECRGTLGGSNPYLILKDLKTEEEIKFIP